ncbi:MAG: ABC transporter permease [Gemmatimonadota bacterium]|nr:ABC transporter permease [Gemmatimonadota bacterium]
MRSALTVFMALHAIAHLVGFAVAWRLLESDEVPFKTTLWFGLLDVGPVGIRLVGLLWLTLAVLFLVASGGALLGQPWWMGLAWATAGTSLVLSVLSLPEARIGIVANAFVIGALALGPRLGWW